MANKTGNARVLTDEFEVTERLARIITVALVENGHDVELSPLAMCAHREERVKIKVYDTDIYWLSNAIAE